MKCSFCGKEFEEAAGRSACESCALFSGCKNVRCPYCGYESPLEPGWIRRLRGEKAKASTPGAASACTPTAADGIPGCRTDAVPMTTGRPGATGTVAVLGTEDSHELRKLLAMGLLPGTRLRLLQRSPAYVFQSGFSQFTIDKALAGLIRVCWDME